MLPAAHRMRRSGDFSRTVRGGVRTGKSTMVVHATASGCSEDAPSVGFVVSKAVGNAVVRNRVKRRMRAVVAHHLDEIPRGTLVVVRSLPEAAEVDFAVLDRDFGSCLGRALKRMSRSADLHPAAPGPGGDVSPS